MTHSKTESFPIGKITVFSQNGAVTKIAMTDHIEDNPDEITESAVRQLHEYFDGTRCSFDFPMKYTVGTPFQQAVWNALQTIPYGKTCSYREIAELIGRPKALRAVGSAVGRNPLFIVNPCHRVISANGKIGGFAYGTAVKIQLLELENKFKELF